MSVLIKGMETPKSCAECRFYGNYCYAKGDENKYSKLPCPLIPVPPHGRLIDADALLKRIDDIWNGRTTFRAATIIEYINEAPTIIPADHIGDVNEMVTDKEGEG